MARYREKDSTDLAWNRIRRQLTRDLDTEIQNRREEALNHLLGQAWDEYVTAIQSGETKEVEAKYSAFSRSVVADIVPSPEELARGASQ